MLPQDKLNDLRLLLRPFWDTSRAVAATWLMQSISSNFWLSMYAFAKQLTSKFHKRRYLVWQNSRWGDITRRTTPSA